ncbi:lipopolysaccharide biosynthesis protein [Oscillospiraceae bacterium N12]|jgi:O-antigen/teichoic acid export membrane protein|uniref:Lipopolysaccharide biosynthesis protein n=1 Tax=Jilunia laotingensis TaxID=2763675 RepID=A0A926IPV8_9BACT|nr:lipopolysaccharide biosynthesis protein [Jilunia laotingensis]MBC8592905.1 lipopolysaccharide biosynthesis protein [Jilunia laotingensis]
MSESLKEKTARGLFWGGISNSLYQLLGLFFGIFLARLLTPDDYGMIGMLTIFSAVANSIQESGFTQALTNRKDAGQDDYNAVFWFSLCTGGVLYLLLFFCAPLIANFYHTPALVPLARFLFLGFLISSAGTAHNAILFKNLMVKEKAKAMLTALTVSGTLGVIMAYYGMAYWGIATQNVVYIFTFNLLLWHYSPWRPTWSFHFQPIREMLPFSIKLLITNVFHFVNDNIFSVLLGRFYTKQEVGYYTQANKWTNMGHTLITGVVNSVSQPIMVEAGANPDRQRKVFRKMLRFTAFISFPLMFGLALIAPEFITIAITDKWLPSAAIMQILCIWGAFLPINYIYTNQLISKGKSNVYMWNTIIQNLVQLLVLLLTVSYGIYVMAAIYVTINILWLFVWHYFVWQLIRITLWNVMKDITPYLSITAISLTAGYFAAKAFSNIYICLINKIVVTALVYIIILWSSKSVIFHESINFLLKRRK